MTDMNVAIVRALSSRYASPYPPRPSAGFESAFDPAPRLPHASSLEQNDQESSTPLWQGAWVGWLTCQAVLVLLVESTELATDPRVALVARSLVLTAFVAAFRKPCFVTQTQRHSFTLSVLGAELAIAACCDRLSGALGWPLWTLLAAAAALLATALGGPSDPKHASRSNHFVSRLR